jgi:arabinose-5-phosphate isomerase
MPNKIIHYAKEVFDVESQAIKALSKHIDEHFVKTVETIIKCKSRVIVCGMGKSGIIGRKISSTLASTGTSSFFMHPGEAFHGDLGVLQREDIVILISYSGETEEILRIIPFLKENGNVLIAMTGNKNSTLAKTANYHLNINVKKEACPLEMAPTSSTTAALVMGDALAVALMRLRGFNEEDFARFHPGGNLGRRLLTKVEDAMIKRHLPVVTPDMNMKKVIPIMTSGRLGLAIVEDKNKAVIGIITDGDLRRSLNKHANLFDYKAKDVMTKNPRSIRKDLLLYEAEQLLNKYSVNALLVCDEKKRLLGIVQFHQV